MILSLLYRKEVRFMSILKIVLAPDPQLKLCSEVVKNVDKSIRKLVDDMFETMHHHSGLGLAAVQVGVHKRILVTSIPKSYEDIDDKIPGYLATSGPLCVINPEILETSQELVLLKEGCLSIPEQSSEVKRPKYLTIKFLDYNGKEQIMRTQGWLARCLEHEIDHLNGLLFINHLSRLKYDLALKSAQKIKRRYENP